MGALPLIPTSVLFTVYAKPQPQGSSRAIMIAGQARITSANKKLKPYRQELTHTAEAAMEELGIARPFAPKHAPVKLQLDFYLERPKSIPKKRISPTVQPDLDKLVRATKDALKGITYVDDGQVIEINARKHYGIPEKTVILVSLL